MVLFQDVRSDLDVELVLAPDVPGELSEGGEVGADDRGLGGVGVHPRHPVQLPVGLLHHRLRQAQGLELLPEGFGLVLFVVRTRELLLERLDLLPQEVLPLVAVDFVFHLALQTTLGLPQLQFGVEQHQRPLEAFGDGGGLEYRLLVAHLEVEVVRDVVGELAGVLEVEDELRHLGLKAAAAVLDEVAELLLELAVRGLEHDRVARLDLVRFDVGLDDAGFGGVLHDGDPAHGAHQHLDAAVGVLLHPHDVAGGPDLVEVLRGRLVDVAVALADDDDGAVAVERGVDGPDRDRTAGVDRHDHGGEEHGAAHGTHGHRMVERGGGSGVVGHGGRLLRRSAAEQGR